jgi:hypothetical protein
VQRAITKKHTLFGAELKLVGIIWTKIRPACTTKDSERGIVCFLLEQPFKRCFLINDSTRCPIDKICDSNESIFPIFKRNRCMSKKS